MGLTRSSSFSHMSNQRQRFPNASKTVVLAGNPNVGKSTLFNQLTGMHQHTGNWPGKTVATAEGLFRCGEQRHRVIDLPGTYSLLSRSPEEEIARDVLCLSSPDAVVVVCDATSPERSLHLTLQIMECGIRPILCVNLLREAERKGMYLDLSRLEALLEIPVVGIDAQRKNTFSPLLSALEATLATPQKSMPPPVTYPKPLEDAICHLLPMLEATQIPRRAQRWVALQLLTMDEGEEASLHLLDEAIGSTGHAALYTCLSKEHHALASAGLDIETRRELTVETLLSRASALADAALLRTEPKKRSPDRRLDRLLTGKYTAYPMMLLLLALVFGLTLSVAGTLSEGIAALFGYVGRGISNLLVALHAPPWLHGALVDGVWSVLSSVVAVMLPPMAIFFPLFTLLEDLGYLPRVAYNLDRPFCCCRACGKQALTMCMGFGCNAAGVVGCRIIDSPRERLLAILTNSLVPCNGRFPALITLISAFLIVGRTQRSTSLLSAALLTLLILVTVGMTFAVTKLLSHTLLRGTPSAFTLELPPYRKPQVGKILVRSVFDRTLFVLARAVIAAAPMGLLLWLLANVFVGEHSLLSHAASLLDPLGQIIGMDGVLLLAFLLGLPANEIVLPIAVMIYRAEGQLSGVVTSTDVQQVFLSNGWTRVTALCVLVFFLFHWPCATTLMTIKKETGSRRYTLLAALIPTLIGIVLCAMISLVANSFF